MAHIPSRARAPRTAQHSGQTLLRELQGAWRNVRGEIQDRLNAFRRLWDTAGEEELFRELVFCLFTPQSKARSCWAAVQSIEAGGLLLSGDRERICAILAPRVRFHRNKSGYLLAARKLLSAGTIVSVRPVLEGLRDDYERREWLVKNVKGLGYKEATHFLRNVGLAEELAILDRHILKNLRRLEVIRSVPKSLTGKTYLQIERRMQQFAREAGIPMNHLDLLLWYRETGEVFK